MPTVGEIPVRLKVFVGRLIPWWRVRARGCLPETDNGGAKHCHAPTTALPTLHEAATAQRRECLMDAETQCPQTLTAKTYLRITRWARCLPSLDEAVEALLPSVVADSVKRDACARV